VLPTCFNVTTKTGWQALRAGGHFSQRMSFTANAYCQSSYRCFEIELELKIRLISIKLMIYFNLIKC